MTDEEIQATSIPTSKTSVPRRPKYWACNRGAPGSLYWSPASGIWYRWARRWNALILSSYRRYPDLWGDSAKEIIDYGWTIRLLLKILLKRIQHEYPHLLLLLPQLLQYCKETHCLYCFTIYSKCLLSLLIFQQQIHLHFSKLF